MKIIRLLALLGIGALALSLGVASFVPEVPGGGPGRESARKAFLDGNYRDAYDAYRALTLAPTPDEQLGKDLEMAIDSLRRLGRSDEIDAMRSEAVAAHPDDWRLLASAGWTIFKGEHHGQLIGGKLFRGNAERQGRYVNTWERDRVEAIRLTLLAARAAKDEAPEERAKVYSNLGQILLNDVDGPGSWRLPRLTDLDRMADFDNGWARPISLAGAPVEPDGSPVYYREPARWEDARNDGERWRWALARAVEADPSQRDAVRWQLAQFFRSQYGVETFLQAFPTQASDDPAGPLVQDPHGLATLTDGETVARLASGVKRFKVPDAYNPLLLYRQLADDPKGAFAEKALQALADQYEIRNQYGRAAKVLEEALARFGPSEARSNRLRQITSPLIRLEAAETQPAGTPGTLILRHRNARRVAFSARPIKLEAILEDIHEYIRKTPEQINWRRLNLSEIGQLSLMDPEKFLGEPGPTWSADLTSPEGHFDGRTKITTPLSKPGAFLVTAKADGGNTVHNVVWLADTILFKRTIAGRTYYQVADAVDGRPIPHARIELFGYRQRVISSRVTSVVDTREETIECDDQGRAFVDSEGLGRVNAYVWLATARTPEGRLAFHGFAPMMNGIYQDYRNDQMKLFFVTDRPSYRPGQVVRYKAWHARVNSYDPADRQIAANQGLTVEVINSKGERVFGRDAVTDEFGSIQGEFTLPSDAYPGHYSLRGLGANGTLSFRVENESAAEHSVSIEVDQHRVLLGAPVTAKIRARTARGEPLTDALVRYKVHRVPSLTRFFPEDAWDWLYGVGYWWPQPDATWAPGWATWGFPSPQPGWQLTGGPPAEVVAEAEVPIGPDGIVLVSFDTALAKTLYGRQDQDYRITAEAFDDQRRAASASTIVTAASRPAIVQVWTEPGFGRAGEPVRALVSARDLAGRRLAAKGTVELRKLVRDEPGGPIREVAVEGTRTPYRPAPSGPTVVTFTPAEPGQYRVACEIDAEPGASIEGGCVLNVEGPAPEGSRRHTFNDLELIPDRPSYKPGDTARILINANRPGSTVYLFVRPMYGVGTVPRVLTLSGQSQVVEIPIRETDQPNIYVEGILISAGRVSNVIREIAVPPTARLVDLSVDPGGTTLRPGQPAKFKIRLRDGQGRPLTWPVALTLYDRQIDDHSDLQNPVDMNNFFWGWRRLHSSVDETSLSRFMPEVVTRGGTSMAELGYVPQNPNLSGRGNRGAAARPDAVAAAPGAPSGPGYPSRFDNPYGYFAAFGSTQAPAPGSPNLDRSGPVGLEPIARASIWAGSVRPGPDGTVEVEVPMPAKLGAWTVRAWTLGPGARVGQSIGLVVTAKDLIVRLETPRFLVEGDEATVEAVVSNRLDRPQAVTLRWDPDAPRDDDASPRESRVEVPARGEVRVARPVRAGADGFLGIGVRASTDRDSDSARASIPVTPEGVPRVVNYPGLIAGDRSEADLTIGFPPGLRTDRTRLDVHAQAGLATVMVDALPALVGPGPRTTEQTLQRFLPLVLAQRTLLRLGVNLNAASPGDDEIKAALSGRPSETSPVASDVHPAFDRDGADLIVRTGLNRLAEIQIADGGWGWFHGFGEQSNPHATAMVVLGLIEARGCDIALEPGVLDRGVAWLTRYQDDQLRRLANRASRTPPYREHADILDALVFHALVEAGIANEAMIRELERSRAELGLIGELHLALALEKLGESRLRVMIEKALAGFVSRDRANGVSELRQPDSTPWWSWKGSLVEANALYLDYLTRTAPQGELTAEVARGLVQARRSGLTWSSVRATGECVSALARYLLANPERPANAAVGIRLDRGQEAMIQVPELSPSHVPSVVRFGDDRPLDPGFHAIRVRKQGETPLFIASVLQTTRAQAEAQAGRLGETKVRREYARVRRDSPPVAPRGALPIVSGTREPIAMGEALAVGDIVEVRIDVDTKHEFEAAVLEDHLAAGMDVLDLSPGYGEAIPNAFVELRDDRVRLHLGTLPKGPSSYTYHLKAGRAGRFTAPPALLSSPYGPDLQVRSTENRFRIREAGGR